MTAARPAPGPDEQGVGRCGEPQPVIFTGHAGWCALPAGHAGWHQGDDPEYDKRAFEKSGFEDPIGMELL